MCAGIQELLGHGNIKTTNIYTHSLNIRGIRVRCPLNQGTVNSKLKANGISGKGQ